MLFLYPQTRTIPNIKKSPPPKKKRKGGVPKTNTPEASPHALPFAPTRANGTWSHLRAILWGLGRAFTPNPNTFTSPRWKALRDAFIRFCREPHLRRMAAMCGWRFASRRGHVWMAVRFTSRPCVDAIVTASFQRFRGVPPLLRPCWWWAGFVESASRARMACRCLGFGGFPTLSLWTTQVRGNKFCEGIVNRGRDCVKEL